MNTIEGQRLEELKSFNIFGSSVESQFDDLTSLAALIFDVPIVAISFIDRDRQFFKSKIGILENETSREKSFCKLVMESKELLVISDVNTETAFKEMAQNIFDPQAQFYAGTPVMTKEGHILGTFFIMDKKPRQLSLKQIGGLKMMAQLTLHLLNIRKNASSLKLKVRNVAHEVNNHAAIISGSIYSLSELTAKQEISVQPIQNGVDRIRSATQKIVKTVKDLRAVVIS
ncbi:MAG: GAF domain-containing protein [Bdellovibrionota bacterium]